MQQKQSPPAPSGQRKPVTRVAMGLEAGEGAKVHGPAAALQQRLLAPTWRA